MTTSFPTNGPYYDIMLSYFPDLTKDKMAQLWDSFLQKEGLSVNPSNIASAEIAFNSYLENLASYPLPTSGYFADTMTSYLGPISDDEKQKIWNSFMLEYGYVLAPDPLDPTVQQQFYKSLAQAYNDLTLQIAYSPGELTQQKMVFSVMDIIITLMQTFSSSLLVQQNSMNFYSSWAAKYTDLMSRMFFYKGNSYCLPVPNANLDKFTLGYGNISVSDIINYVIEKQQSFGIGQGQVDTTLTDALGYVPDPQPFKFNYIDPNTFVFPPPNPPLTSRTFTFGLGYYAPLVTVNYSVNDPIETVIDKCKQAFSDAYFGTQTMQYSDYSFKILLDKALSSEFSTSFNGFTFTGGYTNPSTGVVSDFTLTNPTYVNSNGVTSSQPLMTVSFNSTDTLLQKEQKIYTALANLYTQPAYANLQQTLYGTNLTLATLLSPDYHPQLDSFYNQFSTIWRYNYVLPAGDTNQDNQQFATQQSGYRSNQNQLLQQYLTNAQTQRQVINDRRDAIKDIFNQTNQAIQQSDSIITGTIQQLKNIMNLIFK